MVLFRSPVGSFKPNHNGIYDLTGNLSEWVSDFYSSDIVSNDIIFKDYIGPLFGSSHVIKGSNYNSSYHCNLVYHIGHMVLIKMN